MSDLLHSPIPPPHHQSPSKSPDKLDITAEVPRLQYLNGVLRQKVLKSVDPGRAEQERQIAIVQNCWNRSTWATGL
jgi:hypothetical protein